MTSQTLAGVFTEVTVQINETSCETSLKFTSTFFLTWKISLARVDTGIVGQN